jgi:hypothetical protein
MSVHRLMLNRHDRMTSDGWTWGHRLYGRSSGKMERCPSDPPPFGQGGIAIHHFW